MAIISESNEKAVNLYNRLTETRDGRKRVAFYISKGISREDLVWAINCEVKENVPMTDIVSDYKRWKKFIPSYCKDAGIPIPSITTKTYMQVKRSIGEAIRHFIHHGQVYNDGVTEICAITDYLHASLLPSPYYNRWCICNMESRFNEFFPESGAYLLIMNEHLEDPYKRVMAIVNNNSIEYWDSNNQRMSYITREEEERLAKYELMLSDRAIEFINNYGRSKSITEAELKRLIRKAIRETLSSKRHLSF